MVKSSDGQVVDIDPNSTSPVRRVMFSVVLNSVQDARGNREGGEGREGKNRQFMKLFPLTTVIEETYMNTSTDEYPYQHKGNI